MRLYIANKNYSSWSMRPWIAMRVAGVEFEEVLVLFDDEARNSEFARFSPSGKVPVLVDGDLTVWESLAIMEYVAEKFPDAGLWPRDRLARARARAVASEMHAGFAALRKACPMNMRRKTREIEIGRDTSKDVARIEALWAQCLGDSGGPFLFGDFSIADAMFAPIVSRLEKYELSDTSAVRAYTTAMRSLKAWHDWEVAALAEPWIVPADEA